MNLEEFKQSVTDGQIPDKWYFYKRSESNKSVLIRDMKSLSTFIKDKFNLDLYLIYGTLLGAIRENDFMEHDNDVDLAYMSKQDNLIDILNEFKGMCCILKNHNMLSKICSNGHFHAYSPNRRNKFDMWTSFIIEGKYYIVPLIDGIKEDQIINPLKPINFKNQNFLIPNKPEKLLDLLYKDWKNPILDNKGIINKWQKLL